MAPNFWDNIFVNFGNALLITKILAAKILVLHERAPWPWILQGSAGRRTSYCHQMDNFPVASCTFPAIIIHLCKSEYTRDSQWASAQSSLSQCRRLPATKLGTYAKFMPKRKLPCYLKYYSGQVCHVSLTSYIYCYRTWGTLMLQVITLMSLQSWAK